MIYYDCLATLTTETLAFDGFLAKPQPPSSVVCIHRRHADYSKAKSGGSSCHYTVRMAYAKLDAWE